MKIKEMSKNYWEVVHIDNTSTTKRMRVPGGWLVSIIYYTTPINYSDVISSMSFVPDKEHQWEIENGA